MWTIYIMRDYSHSSQTGSEREIMAAYDKRREGGPGCNIVAMFVYDDESVLRDHCFLRA